MVSMILHPHRRLSSVARAINGLLNRCWSQPLRTVSFCLFERLPEPLVWTGIRSVAASTERWIVSTETAYFPIWTRDGKHIAYRTSQDQIRVVDVVTEPEFGVGQSRTIAVDQSRYAREYDMSRDGRRVLIGLTDINQGKFGKEVRPRISLVLNWFDELKRRAD